VTDSGVDNRTSKVCKTCKELIVGEHKTCAVAESPTVMETPAVPDPLIGTIFAEKYEVLSVLGKGGMSLVYKARHKFMDRIVAVKVLLEHLVTDAAAVQRFQQESKAASTLNHQNIVTVYDFGQTPNGQAYFVMDCLEGKSLSDYIEKDGRLAVPRALEIFEQICDGLEHAHQKGIIHRDLKPNNIVLLPDEQGREVVKIVDFGIAKIIGTDGTPQQRLTQTGEIFGSPFYMSPEQCQGFTLDTRSDLYSFGCLMFETLTGSPPQMGDSFVATALKHINDQPPSFSDVAPNANIPKQVEYVIQRCLEKSPKERFATAAELKQALMDAALAGGVPGLRAGAVKVADPKSTARQAWNKLGIAFDTGSYAANKNKKKAVSAMRTFLTLVPILLLVPALLVAFLFPGGPEDHGTPWNKFVWQCHMSAAKWYGDQGNLTGARQQFAQAEAMTSTFQDKSSRLLKTLTLEADVYKTLKDFDSVSTANQRFIDVGTKEASKEADGVRSWLKEIDDREKIDPISCQASLQSGAMPIRFAADKLHVRSLFGEEESLLNLAITEYNHAGLGQSPELAQFKSSLADCMLLQQNLDKVRPLLAEVLAIRENRIVVMGGLSSAPAVKDAIRDLIKALLRIAEFDRDQSNFTQSQSEFARAKKLLDQYEKGNTVLNQEYVLSTADLQRQMNLEHNRSGASGKSAVCVPNLEPGKSPSKKAAGRTSN
jgi:serine/threonine protein kinase